MSHTLSIRHSRQSARVSGQRLSQRLLEGLLLWQRRAAERHALRALSNRDLKDVGLSRADIESEAAKPFWRA